MRELLGTWLFVTVGVGVILHFFLPIKGYSTPIATCMVVGGLFVYILPTVIADYREHHNKGSIEIINVLLGWTGIAWVICLAWSASHVQKGDA